MDCARIVGSVFGVLLVEFVVDSVRCSIFDGWLLAGEWILFDDFVEDFGISLILVCEVLRVVVIEGFVVLVARRGYIVALVRVEDLEETYWLCLLLEPLVVQLVVLWLTDVDIDEFLEEFEAFVEVFCDNDWFNYWIYYWVFYFGIYNHCNSFWLLRFMEMLWVNSERY